MNIDLDDLLALNPRGRAAVDQLPIETIRGVSTDSRTTRRGDIFFAIRGERFDGHKFIRDAVQRGAVCAVVDEKVEDHEIRDLPVVIVRDTIKALGTLAHRHRKKFRIPFLAITGSNGKTTTKEMIAAVLNRKYNVLKTEGNLNNHIGVPLTLLRLERKHQVAIVEIGSNHPGEVEALCRICEPTHGLVTNIGREHLEFFKDLRGVAREEGSVFRNLASPAIGFVNLDDSLVTRQARNLRKRTTYGVRAADAMVRGKVLEIGTDGCAVLSVLPRGKRAFSIQLSVAGPHAAVNALAAAAVGLHFRVPAREIRWALTRFRAPDKRMQVLKKNGVVILNDTYNSNPSSVVSALETLRAVRSSGKKIVVLADMLELGELAQAEHRNVGKLVSDFGFDYLLTFGPLSAFTHEAATLEAKFHYDQKNVLSEYLAELVSPGDVVLIKGSRGMKMEDVLTFLERRLDSAVASRVATA